MNSKAVYTEPVNRIKQRILFDDNLDNMSMEDFRQYVRNDMADFLYNCSESEVLNEFLIKVEHTTDEQFYNKFVKQNKGILL